MHRTDPFQVVRDFEQALCFYTGARYAVTTTSCTSALLITLAYCFQYHTARTVRIPRRTYVGVGMSVLNAGGSVSFTDEPWSGSYQLLPLPVFDCARTFTSGMYRPGAFQCVSFHHTKILGLAAHGGVILHDNADADHVLRRMRFDGRAEGFHPRDDTFEVRGFHCYMTPPTAAEGLLRLAALPKHNAPLPNSDYSDLSTQKVFQ